MSYELTPRFLFFSSSIGTGAEIGTRGQGGQAGERQREAESHQSTGWTATPELCRDLLLRNGDHQDDSGINCLLPSSQPQRAEAIKNRLTLQQRQPTLQRLSIQQRISLTTDNKLSFIHSTVCPHYLSVSPFCVSSKHH